MTGATHHAASLERLAAGRATEALEAARAAVAAFHASVGPEHPDSANAALARARAALAAGELDEARTAAETARATIAALTPDPTGPIARIAVQARCAAAEAARRQGRYPAAAAGFRAAIDEAERWLGPADPDLALACNGLALVARYRGAHDDAERGYRRALAIVGRDGLDGAAVLHNLAGLEHARGRAGNALALARRAWEIRVRELGPDHPDALGDQAQVGELLRCDGRLDEAEGMLDDVRRRWAALRGDDDLEVAIALHGLALVAADRGDHRTAVTRGRAALRIKRARLGPNHPELAATLHNLGRSRRAAGDPAGGRRALAQAVLVLERAGVTGDHPVLVACRRGLAEP
ncbi:tetratricopeptide repeat protein [Patulibacter defluvii]|uniref:tetratricopeptide repeat protein n=1 Tax=Patulibacter defluvii TaxID=3095358 RepID=UPI002A74950E|nr:tetratricopeptide repeat protein [Patulibacter sp. DM4]